MPIPEIKIYNSSAIKNAANLLGRLRMDAHEVPVAYFLVLPEEVRRARSANMRHKAGVAALHNKTP